MASLKFEANPVVSLLESSEITSMINWLPEVAEIVRSPVILRKSQLLPTEPVKLSISQS